MTPVRAAEIACGLLLNVLIALILGAVYMGYGAWSASPGEPLIDTLMLFDVLFGVLGVIMIGYLEYSLLFHKGMFA